MKNSNISDHCKDDRPTWDQYYMGVAKLISSRTTCLRRAVGCVLTLDNRILSTGYNGTPVGVTHCEKKGCIRELLNVPSGERHEMCRGLHGEQNALLQCALHGISTKDSVLYSTTFPCSVCAKLLINAKVKKIIFLQEYKDDLSKELLYEAGIEIIKYEEPNEN